MFRFFDFLLLKAFILFGFERHLTKVILSVTWRRLFWASPDEGYSERHLTKVILNVTWRRLFWASPDEGYSERHLTKVILSVTWRRLFQKRVVSTNLYIYVFIRVMAMVLNATFNNISVISWLSVLLVEETGVPRENHRPVISHWQPRLNMLGTDCIDSYKSNYHTITTTPCLYIWSFLDKCLIRIFAIHLSGC
jgi:hypothetical protein